MSRYQFNARLAWRSTNGGEWMHGSKDLNALAAGFHKPPENDFDTQWRRKVFVSNSTGFRISTPLIEDHIPKCSFNAGRAIMILVEADSALFAY
jgi:hypothetical protein